MDSNDDPLATLLGDLDPVPGGDELTSEEQAEFDRRVAANTEALKLPWIERELPPS